MASVTLAQAAVQSQIPLTKGIIYEFLTHDTFTSQLPFMPVIGKGVTFSRLVSEHGGTWLDINGTVNKTQATATNVTFPLGRAGGDIEVDEFLVGAMNENDLVGSHLQSLTRRLARRWAAAVIAGTGTFPQPKGLHALCTGTQTLDDASAEINTTATVGCAISFKNLDYLLDQVKADGQKFLMASGAVIRKFATLVRASGSATDYAQVGLLNPLTGEVGYQKVLAFSGVPFFQNDNITTTTVAAGAVSRHWVIAGALGGDGIYGIMPQSIDSVIQTRGPIDDNDRDLRIIRQTLTAGLALKSALGLARLKNVVLTGGG